MHVILFISLLLLLLFLAIDVLLAEERDRVAQADDSQVRDCGRGQAQVGVRGCDLEQRKEHDHHGQVQQAHGALRRRVERCRGGDREGGYEDVLHGIHVEKVHQKLILGDVLRAHFTVNQHGGKLGGAWG